jgi:hypothetical protein
MGHRIRHINPHTDVEYVGQINKLRTLKRNSGQKFAWNNWKSLPGMARCLCSCGEVYERKSSFCSQITKRL